MAVSFADAIAVRPVDDHTYSATLVDDWCIGSVPNGGYVTSLFLQVAQTHFTTTLSSQNQPHTIALHLSFLRRTAVGPATFTVHAIKLGRQTSTLHISLTQPDQADDDNNNAAATTTPLVVGYLTNTNLSTESGVSLPTRWALQPPRPPADLRKLKAGADALWAEKTAMPFARFRKATAQLRFFFPRAGQPATALLADEWVCFRDGARFTQASVGLLSDMWPQLVEMCATDGDDDDDDDDGQDPYRPPAAAAASSSSSTSEVDGGERSSAVSKGYWYPTVLLNLEVKKKLPEDGVEWLFARVRAKQIRNGRMDLEVVILDEGGEIVALSHHVVMVVSAERNVAARRKRTEGGSKI